jgi:triphosphoribosyl-dephospho-CoA synthase
MIKTIRCEFSIPRNARNWPYTRGSNSAVSTGIDDPSRSAAADDRSRLAAYLANLAVRALIEEAELTPKPALVDRRGSGAHTDLTLQLMRCSACALRPGFELMALASFRQIPHQSLREELGAIGRRAEQSMLQATGGANTHRGAIWSLGLLVSAAAMGANSPDAAAYRASQLAELPDWSAPKQQSNGSRVIQSYRVPGARGEAQAGFPHVLTIGLPILHRSRQQGSSETRARLDALLAIMASLDDTCLLHRGGWAALNTAQTGAAAVFAAGGTATVQGWGLLERLCETRHQQKLTMERLHFEYAASQPIKQRAHVGVVGSGDLEVLLEPSPDQKAHVTITTSVDGFGKTWKLVMDRFFSHYQYAASIEVHDFGATPGAVALRLEQAMERSQS